MPCLLKAGLGENSAGIDTVAAAKEVGSLAPGEIFGHYRLVRLLGKGGMGAVYEAEDLENGRHVAVKIMKEALDSTDLRKRFLRGGAPGRLSEPSQQRVRFCGGGNQRYANHRHGTPPRRNTPG